MKQPVKRTLSRQELLIISDCILCKLREIDEAYRLVLTEETRKVISQERKNLYDILTTVTTIAEQ